MKKTTSRRWKLAGLTGMLAVCLLLTGCVVPPEDIDTSGDYVVTQGDLPFQSLRPGPTNTPYTPPTASPTPTATPTRNPYAAPTGNPANPVNPGNIGVNTATKSPVQPLPGVITPVIGVPTTVPSTSNGTLRLGATGSEVKKLQERLRELGYLKGSADGDFGTATETAVKNFQAQNGLTVDGAAGPATQQRLYSSAAKAAPSTTRTNTPRPTNTPFTSLKVGSTGSDVREMQRRLRELGYLSGSADGDFGEATEEAVRAFQQRNGLEVDGKAGSATLQKLYSSSARAAATATAKPTATATPFTSLKLGSTGSAVKELQQRLRALGYLNSWADGEYGEATEEAVKAFQRRHGLTPDGKAGTVTLGILYSTSAKEAATQAPTNTPKPTTLKYGDEGEAVKELQERLKELGFYTNWIDGQYGYVTVEAVKAFQQRNGLTADGKAGTVTLGLIYSSYAKPAYTEKPTNTPEPTTLKNGAQGQAVKDMQQRLRDLGYLDSWADGNFGDVTERAVKAFQSNNGLTPDGKAGPSTLKKLYANDAKPAVTPTAKPTATPKAETLNYYLELGNTGKKVTTLQNRLIELGWLDGSADGSYGHATEYAIKAFQARYRSLWTDGIAGPDTLAALYSDDAAKSTVPAATLGMSLAQGDSGDAVKAMQKRLKELGFYDRSADGNFGAVTEAAVIAFQNVNGLTADGKATSATLNKLYSAEAKDASHLEDEENAKNEEEDTPSQEPENATDISVSGYRTLRWGDTGAQVKKLQEALKQRGYYTGKIDSTYGSGVYAAVRSFQQEKGLKADGIAGPVTQIMLYGASAREEEISTPLRKGDSGVKVRNLQYVLYELGYYDDPIDGDYNDVTVQAVKAFQQRNGLSAVDGIAGTETLRVLYSDAALRAAVSAGTFTPLQKDDKGILVEELQERLVNLGYLSEVTGEYDNATVEAVKNLQRRNSLYVDGKAGQKTLTLIYTEDPVPAW